ncbi:MAG: phosphate ABC transporter permease subunit PstC [Candidatus Thermoplasmatota archaeon]
MLPRHIKEKIIKNIFLIIAATSIFIILFIFFFLFQKALPAFQQLGLDIFSTKWSPTQGEYGIGGAIFGTILVTIGAMLIAIPFGLLGAIFLSEIAPNKLRVILKPVIEILAGIPSVIYGFIGVVILVPYLQPNFDMLSGYSILAGSLILGVMALPIIISMSDDAIKSVPKNFKEASLALGATKWETIKKITLPSAISGISAAIVLGMGRAIGETIAVSLVLANNPKIPSPFWDFFETTGTTLTALIVNEMGEAYGLQTNALFSAAVILFVIVAALSITSNILKNRIEKKFKGGK